MLKRITSLLLAAGLILCLAACGSSPESTDTVDDPIGDIASTLSPATSTPKATEEPEETPEPTDEAEPTPSPTPVQTPSPTPSVTTPTPEPTPVSTPEQTPVASAPAESPEASGAPDEGAESDSTTSPEPETEGVDLQAFYDTISATYEFSSMMDMDTEMMDAYYPGLSAVSKAQFVGKIAMITASANEIVLIECSDSADVDTVRAILESRRQSQIDGGAWYPESIAMWEGAQICVSGNFLMLVSHGSAADIAASFNALFAE